MSVDSVACAGKILKNFKKKVRHPVSEALKTSTGCVLFPKLSMIIKQLTLQKDKRRKGQFYS